MCSPAWSTMLAMAYLLISAWWAGAAADDTEFPVTNPVFEGVREVVNGAQVNGAQAVWLCNPYIATSKPLSCDPSSLFSLLQCPWCRGNLVLRHPTDKFHRKAKDVPQGTKPFVVFCAERLADKAG